MELAERYAYRVYAAKSFTAAAKELYISQPALSAMITKLESTLGFRIFDRSTSPLSLTPAGRIYIEYLQSIISEESSMKKRIQQLSEIGGDSLSVSVFSQTAYYAFAPLCAAFTKQHPEVSITADIGNNSTIDFLLEKLRNNILDVIFTDHAAEKEFLSVPIFRDRIVIAMHKDLCRDPELLSFAVTRDEILKNAYDESKEITDLSLLGGIPFLPFEDQNTTALIFSELSADSVSPSLFHIKNSRNLMMHYYMMGEGLGATIADASHLSQPAFADPDLLYFIPNHPSAHRTLYGILQKSRRNDPLVKSFLDTAKALLSEPKQKTSPIDNPL